MRPALVLLAVIMTPRLHAQAAADTPRGLVIPAAIGRFQQVDKRAAEDFPSDTMYRFSDGSSTNLTVVDYPIRPDARRGSDPKRWLERESQKWIRSMPIAVSRGWIDRYEVATSQAWDAVSGSLTVPGHGVVINTAKGAVRFVDFQFLYLVRGRFLKFRATVPDTGQGTFDAPLIAKELALTVARN